MKNNKIIPIDIWCYTIHYKINDKSKLAKFISLTNPLCKTGRCAVQYIQVLQSRTVKTKLKVSALFP